MTDNLDDLLLDSQKDLYDFLPNPDKFDDVDPDFMLTTPCSDYCGPSQLYEILNLLIESKFATL